MPNGATPIRKKREDYRSYRCRTISTSLAGARSAERIMITKQTIAGVIVVCARPKSGRKSEWSVYGTVMVEVDDEQ